MEIQGFQNLEDRADCLLPRFVEPGKKGHGDRRERGQGEAWWGWRVEGRGGGDTQGSSANHGERQISTMLIYFKQWNWCFPLRHNNLFVMFPKIKQTSQVTQNRFTFLQTGHLRCFKLLSLVYWSNHDATHFIISCCGKHLYLCLIFLLLLILSWFVCL